MGVTIHYRGKLKSTDLIATLIEEVEEICLTNDWNYQIHENNTGVETESIPETTFLSDDYDPDFGFENIGHSTGLRGISFEPHEESESVSFFV